MEELSKLGSLTLAFISDDKIRFRDCSIGIVSDGSEIKEFLHKSFASPKEM